MRLSMHVKNTALGCKYINYDDNQSLDKKENTKQVITYNLIVIIFIRFPWQRLGKLELEDKDSH